jgi:flagellar protein FliS
MSASRGFRQAYVRDTVDTVSPARLVVMLYERLCRDLEVAGEAIDAGDVAKAHDNLVHAQEIVAELHSALDVGAWEHAGRLGDLYTWVVDQLVAANVHKVREPADAALRVLRPLLETWREVGGVVVAPAQRLGA